MWLATVGMIVGAASVLGLQAAHNRLRHRSNTKKRIGSLDSLVVGQDPLEREPPRKPDRPTPNTNGDEVGSVEAVAEISDRDARQDTVSDPDLDPDDVDEPVEEVPASNVPPAVDLEVEQRFTESSTTATLLDTRPDDSPPIPDEAPGPIPESAVPTGTSATAESSSDLDSAADEADLADLTGEEMAMLFNRYEYFARNDLESASDNGYDIDAEIWLDLTQGEAWAYIDTTRSTSEGRWVHLISGESICKLRGSDVWTRVDDRKRDPIKPPVVVSLEAVPEPTELIFVIPRNSRA